MSTLRITLFGRFSVWFDGHPVDGLDARKAQELFCYLLLHRDQPQHRAYIAGLLWGDVPDATAKRYLSKALWQLQLALEGPQREMLTEILCAEPDWIQLNRAAPVWLDTSFFEKVYVSFHQKSGSSLHADQAQILEAAVHLYRGALLDGWYQEWCVLERQRFQHLLQIMLDKLADYCEFHLQYESALDYGRRILYHDSAHEHTHRRLMRLRYLSGDRTGALRQYKECVSALEDELGVAPSAGTQLLYECICTGRMPNGKEPAADDSVGSHDAMFLQKTLARLHRLQVTAQITNARLQQEIEALERLLHQPSS